MTKPHFDRLVGIPPEDRGQRAEIAKRVSHILEARGGEPLEGEIEATQKDWEIMDIAEDALKRKLEVAGNEYRPFPFNNVHLMPVGGTNRFTGGQLGGGAHSTVQNGIIIDRSPSDVDFALALFHELAHAASYRAVRMHPDGTYSQHRSGFSVTSSDGKETYFVDMMEAFIGIWTAFFFKDIICKHPLFEREIREMRKNGDQAKLTRGEEFEKLDTLISDIYQRHHGRFSSKAEIVGLFFDAHVHGNLLPVGRLIEETYGKGSFRRLGKGEDITRPTDLSQ